MGACYFSLGISIPLEWVDEGHIVYPSWRVSQGAIPYRDFGHLYGPSLFWVNGALFRAFGEDLMILRVFILLLKTSSAIFVYNLAARVASQVWALAAFAITLVVWGLPFPIFTTPYASYYGLTLSLAGILVVAALPKRTILACIIAGMCFGLATTFKQTTGIFGAMAVALFLLTESNNEANSSGTAILLLARAVRYLVLVAAAGTLAAYMTPQEDMWSLLIIFTPAWIIIARLVHAEYRGNISPASQAQSLACFISLGTGMALPLLLCASYFASLGLFDQLWLNTIAGVPGYMNWYVPLSGPQLLLPWAGLWLVAVLINVPTIRQSLTVIIVLVTVGIVSTTALVIQADFNTRWWFWSTRELMHLLPALVTFTALAMWYCSNSTEHEPASGEVRSSRLLMIYASTSLLFLHPSGDIWHVLLCLPVFLPLLARQLYLSASGSKWRTSIAAVGVAALLIPGAHDLINESAHKTDNKHTLKRASGIAANDPAARQVARLVRLLEQPAYRERPLFVMSGKQMIYFLAGRTSALEEYELGLYLLKTNVLNKAGYEALLDADAMIERLRETRALVIEDSQDHSSKLFRDALPEVAQFIEENYAPAEWKGRFGLRAPLSERGG